MNNILLERGVRLSLSRQATTTMDNLLEKGRRNPNETVWSTNERFC